LRVLWAPWRLAYVEHADEIGRCIFCEPEPELLVADGETAVIAGLTVTEVTVEKTGIPFLVDLPILGKLFGFSSQTENRRDLIILITPHIIDDLATPTPGTGNN